jgi:hypothetical protein
VPCQAAGPASGMTDALSRDFAAAVPAWCLFGFSRCEDGALGGGPLPTARMQANHAVRWVSAALSPSAEFIPSRVEGLRTGLTKGSPEGAYRSQARLVGVAKPGFGSGPSARLNPRISIRGSLRELLAMRRPTGGSPPQPKGLETPGAKRRAWTDGLAPKRASPVNLPNPYRH